MLSQFTDWLWIEKCDGTKCFMFSVKHLPSYLVCTFYIHVCSLTLLVRTTTSDTYTCDGPKVIGHCGTGEEIDLSEIRIR
jgi:hypothetical protein